jgi:hypothetical protein
MHQPSRPKLRLTAILVAVVILLSLFSGNFVASAQIRSSQATTKRMHINCARQGVYAINDATLTTSKC